MIEFYKQVTYDGTMLSTQKAVREYIFFTVQDALHIGVDTIDGVMQRPIETVQAYAEGCGLAITDSDACYIAVRVSFWYAANDSERVCMQRNGEYLEPID